MKRLASHGKVASGFLGLDVSYMKTVPCCISCNTLLGDCSCTDVRDRARFIAQRYENTRHVDAERLTWMRNVALIESDEA